MTLKDLVLSMVESPYILTPCLHAYAATSLLLHARPHFPSQPYINRGYRQILENLRVLLLFLRHRWPAKFQKVQGLLGVRMPSNG